MNSKANIPAIRFLVEVNRKSGADVGLQLEDKTFVYPQIIPLAESWLKKQHMASDKKSVRASRRATSHSTKSGVSFTTLPQVKSSPTPPEPQKTQHWLDFNPIKSLLQGSFIPPRFGKRQSFKSQLSSDESG